MFGSSAWKIHVLCFVLKNCVLLNLLKFYVFEPCFRMLAVILVLDFCIPLKIFFFFLFFFKLADVLVMKSEKLNTCIFLVV